jgi:hypothetical protein
MASRYRHREARRPPLLAVTLAISVVKIWQHKRLRGRGAMIDYTVTRRVERIIELVDPRFKMRRC